MKKQMILSGAAALVFAGVAGADYKIDFEDFFAAGGDFTELVDGSLVEGELTGLCGDFSITGATGTAWANDLAIIFGDNVFQAGGASDLVGAFGGTYLGQWGNGSSGVDGAMVTSPEGDINFVDPVDVTGLSISLGNGWTGSDLSGGTWTGSITLKGITVVPAPGAIALLGLGGLVARRRRG